MYATERALFHSSLRAAVMPLHVCMHMLCTCDHMLVNHNTPLRGKFRTGIFVCPSHVARARLKPLRSFHLLHGFSVPLESAASRCASGFGGSRGTPCRSSQRSACCIVHDTSGSYGHIHRPLSCRTVGPVQASSRRHTRLHLLDSASGLTTVQSSAGTPLHPQTSHSPPHDFVPAPPFSGGSVASVHAGIFHPQTCCF